MEKIEILKIKLLTAYSRKFNLYSLLFFISVIIYTPKLFAQQVILQDTVTTADTKDTTAYGFEHLYDIGDGIKDIGRFIRRDTTTKVSKKRSGISILPNINYNPSIGFQIGA